MQLQRTLRFAIVPLLFCAPALFGLNARSAVSINGLDSNPCTPASPCRSFNVAIGVTSSGGEVIALDTAGYGPFIVGMPLTVSGAPGIHAALTVAGGNGITVAAGASDTVVIRNLTLIGAGGTNGIVDIASSDMTVIGCSVSGFSNDGILIQSTATNVSIQNSSVFENTAYGIDQAAGGSPHRILVSGSLVHFNQNGIRIEAAGSLVVTDSTISANFTNGVQADAGGGDCSITVKRCALVGNLYGVGVITTNPNVATAWLSANVLAFNEYGVANSSVTNTYGNNRFDFNFAGPVIGTAMVPAALH